MALHYYFKSKEDDGVELIKRIQETDADRAAGSPTKFSKTLGKEVNLDEMMAQIT